MTVARRTTARVLHALGAVALLSSVLLVAQPAIAEGGTTTSSRSFGAVSQPILVLDDLQAAAEEPVPAAAAEPVTAAAAPKPCDPLTQDCSPGRSDQATRVPRPCDPGRENCSTGAAPSVPSLPSVPSTPSVPSGPSTPRPCDPAFQDCGTSTPTRPTADQPDRPPLPALPPRPTTADRPTGGGDEAVVGTRARPGARTDSRPNAGAPTCSRTDLTCRRAVGAAPRTSARGSGSAGGGTSAVEQARATVSSGVSAVLARTGTPVLSLAATGALMVLAGAVLSGWRPRRPRHRAPVLRAA